MDDEKEGRIPYTFLPRNYQLPFVRAVQRSIEGRSSVRYFFQVWHRRSGKDLTNIGFSAPRRLAQDNCLVKYVYPTLVMGREHLWDGIVGNGNRFLDNIPPYMRVGEPNSTLMKVNTNYFGVESLFQIGGSDHPDTLRGGNPKMIIFSEWSEQDPYAWDVVEPILKENDGIAIFNMTPKGDNHARGMYEYALAESKRENPKWWVQTLTAKDTGIWTPEKLLDIQQDIVRRFAASGRSESEALAYFEQEYMCSFNSPVIGAYYGDNIRVAYEEKRIGTVPYNQGFPVDTFWDLGMDDSMTIWFGQVIGQTFFFIDYYENSGEGFPHYAKVLQEKHYLYHKHYAPFDISVRELGTGKSRLESAASLGIKFDVAPKLEIEDGINAVRTIFNRCWFDADKCARGLAALKNYRKEWDEKNKVFRNNAKHDWASHGSDAFRTFAVGYRQMIANRTSTPVGGVLPYIPGVG